MSSLVTSSFAILLILSIAIYAGSSSFQESTTQAVGSVKCPKGFKYVDGECELPTQDNIVKLPRRCPPGMGLAANGRCVAEWST